VDKIVNHWIERSQYDLDTAKVMLDTGRYLYVAYMCQRNHLQGTAFAVLSGT
jgi:HEPN domain-containing protein